MKVHELKERLNGLDTLQFTLENGHAIPAHFHITEIGVVTKHFIDCGGMERIERVANFQLWTANDLEHRLSASKLLEIIALSEARLGLGNLEIEVEFQDQTIGKYGLSFIEDTFVLTHKQTACLAEDQCGVKPAKPKIALADLGTKNCCNPTSGCC